MNIAIKQDSQNILAFKYLALDFLLFTRKHRTEDG